MFLNNMGEIYQISNGSHDISQQQISQIDIVVNPNENKFDMKSLLCIS